MGSVGTTTILTELPSSIHSSESPPLIPSRRRMAAGIDVCNLRVTFVLIQASKATLQGTRALYKAIDDGSVLGWRMDPPLRMELPSSAVRVKEGDMYTAYCRELDIASCGTNTEEAWGNLREAFDIFLQETRRKGTLEVLLEEAGLTKLRPC